MSRVPLTVRKQDIQAGVRALEAIGKQVFSVEVGKDGRIIFNMFRKEGDDAEPLPDLVAELKAWQP